MASFVYEGLLLFGIALIPGAMGALVVARFGEQDGFMQQVVLQLIAFVLFGAYFIGFWVRRGQTLAMQTWQIRLVSKGGDRVGWIRAGARYVASWIWIAPPALAGALLQWRPTYKLGAIAGWILLYALLAMLHPRRQFWHDAICGTRLVTQPPSRKT